MIRTVTIKEVNFKEQTLKLQKDYPEEYLKAYTIASSENHPSAKIIYEEAEHHLEFSTIEEFGEYIEKYSVNIADLAIEKTYDFAVFLSCCLELGRVIRNHQLYKGLKKIYNIQNLDNYHPAINNNEIVFWTYFPKSENNFSPPLVENKCLLSNLRYQKREVYKFD